MNDCTNAIRCVKCGKTCGSESFMINENCHGVRRDIIEHVGPVCEQCYVKHLRDGYRGYLGVRGNGSEY